MPHYRFETDAGRDGARVSEIELADTRAAQVEAVRFLGELLAQDGAEFWREGMASMVVSDETGLHLFRLDLSAIQSPALGAPREIDGARAGEPAGG